MPNIETERAAYLYELDRETENEPTIEQEFLQYKNDLIAGKLKPLPSLEDEIASLEVSHPDLAAEVRNGIHSLKAASSVSSP